MPYLKHDEGDTVEGLEENGEPRADCIDSWARKTVRVQVADEEFMSERATEEKRKIRALQFIGDKVVRIDVPRQQKLVPTKAASKLTGAPSSRADSQITQEQKKKYTINKATKVEEPKGADDDLRTRKAQELKSAYDIERKLQAGKEQSGMDEKKRQKMQYELKKKAYTYDLKGKIVFLPKETQKFPEIPAAKTQWAKTEDTYTSPHYAQFKLIADSSAILKEEEKKYKEYRTGDMPESETITLAKSKAIKVSDY